MNVSNKSTPRHDHSVLNAPRNVIPNSHHSPRPPLSLQRPSELFSRRTPLPPIRNAPPRPSPHTRQENQHREDETYEERHLGAEEGDVINPNHRQVMRPAGRRRSSLHRQRRVIYGGGRRGRGDLEDVCEVCCGRGCFGFRGSDGGCSG